ncbi:uncharacterized protein EURHEDRAFT_541056 [Aspergillus ruber CBS 135680]|uniref:Rhodopsin domain-containing protein n=1 Tax=Aspergillus ruber (strain CBS 135680) TaxID=1388766 RepID=A0A017SSG0_ASPRC|nr:uncharacterized protein EURHEDRAFT_541056 [Aspergillus ruber CBS 135680]EYE99210.1 hypothetical protein EURHEDRAFT_541056 [Aspergillus ruber CBS 135680]
MNRMDEDPGDDIAYRIWIGTIVTVVPATVITALRFTARTVSRVGLWWDDYTIAAALVINWGMAATRWAQVLMYDHGRHTQYVASEKVINFQISFIAVQITYFCNAVFTKASLLLLYHRIFGVVSGFRWALGISAFLVTAYFIACTIVTIAGCSPVSYYWYRHQEGSCIDEVNFYRWNGIVNMLLDVLVLCLPFPMTCRVKTCLRQKLILTGIFLLGGFVCIVSVLRIIAFDFSDANDPMYSTIDTATWSSIEQSVGIICACLPTLRPMFRQLYDATRHSTDKESGSGSHTLSYSLPIRLSQLGSSQTEADGSTVCFARLPTATTATDGSRSRASSMPHTRVGYEMGFDKYGYAPSIPSVATGGRSRAESSGFGKEAQQCV